MAEAQAAGYDQIDYNPENTIIFTIARMNPPTPGHLFLIESLIRKAISINIDQVYVILSVSNSDNENPITCEEKRLVLGKEDDIKNTMIQTLKQNMVDATESPETKAKILNIKVHTICIRDVFTPIETIVRSRISDGIKDINLIVIMGEDRNDFIDSIATYFVDDKNKKWPEVYSIDKILLERENMDEYKTKSNRDNISTLNISSVPISAMSASFVRNIVKFGTKDNFVDVYKPYLDPEKIDLLYDLIHRGLTSLPEKTTKSKPKSKEDDKKPPIKKKYVSKYTYPFIKSDRDTKRQKVSGGLKRTYTTRKYKNNTYKNKKNKNKNKKTKRTHSKNKRTYKKRYTRK